jgi:hypothetical protein
MKRWVRLLLLALAVPLLVITDASPQPGGGERDRRFDAVVTALQWAFRVYVLAALVAFFWQAPAGRWGGNGFGPLLDPVLAVHEGLAVAVIGTLGTLFTAAALACAGQVAFLLWRGRRTTATVVADTSPAGSPAFRFTDGGGRERVVCGAVARLHGTLRAGQRVSLVYLPGSPETFILDRARDKWAAPLLLLLLGLLLLFPCVAVAAVRLL